MAANGIELQMKTDGAAMKPHEEKEAADQQKEFETRHCVLLGIAEVVFIFCYALFTEYGADVKGTSGAANSLTSYYGLFQDVHVMIFIGFGFLMTFMKRYSFSSVGFNFLLAALTIQYAMLVSPFFHMMLDKEKDFDTIQLDITSLICGDFAAAAVLISFGAVLGKASMGQLCVMMALEIIFFAFNEAVGVVHLKAVDMGGSMYVHTFGAYFGLAVSYVLTNANSMKRHESAFGSTYTSDTFAMVGTLFLWMFWPSFNGALASGANQHRVVVNTVLSLTNSCVSAFIFSKILRPGKRLDMVDIQNATLAGGVAVGSAADLVINPHGALIIGFISGALSVYGYVKISPWLEDKIGLHDTCGVHNLHGMPGVMGGLGGAVAAAMAKNSDYSGDIGSTFAGVADDGRSAGEQAVFQVLALAMTVGVAIVGGYITGKVMKMQEDPVTYGDDALNWTIDAADLPEGERMFSPESV